MQTHGMEIPRSQRSLRLTVLLLGILLLLSGAAPLLVRALADAPDVPKIDLNSAKTEPRALEDSTQRAVLTQYSTAWKGLEGALADNRADLLNDGFTGNAQSIFTDQVKQQKSSGLSVHYIDQGHKVDITFYSPEGSAIELHDTAQLEMRVMNGGKVVHSETVTRKYLALMTVADDRWKVRVLQELQ